MLNTRGGLKNMRAKLREVRVLESITIWVEKSKIIIYNTILLQDTCNTNISTCRCYAFGKISKN